MEIKLIKTEEANFSLNESKCKEFDFSDIMFLSGVEEQNYVEDDTQKYVVFRTREDFFENYSKYDIDKTKKILINDKGNFFCPIKRRVTISKSQTDTGTKETAAQEQYGGTTNESTNSKEN